MHIIIPSWLSTVEISVNSLNPIYLAPFWRYRLARCWVKIAVLNNLPHYCTSHLYLAPTLGVTPSEFRKITGIMKTRVSGVSYGVVCVILRLAIFTSAVPACFGRTDRQTDTHDDDDDISYRASVASRNNELYGWAKKVIPLVHILHCTRGITFLAHHPVYLHAYVT